MSMELHHSVKSVRPRYAAHPKYASFRNCLYVYFSSFDSSHDSSEGIVTGLKEALAFYLAGGIVREKVYDINPEIRCTLNVC